MTPKLQVEFTKSETKSFLRNLPWGDLRGELVMHVGCGFGEKSTKFILEEFPRVKRVVAIDNDYECIHKSKERYRQGILRKADFHLANIEVMRNLRRWKGRISKIISTHSISELDRKQSIFENMFDLLKPGGQVALLFASKTAADEVFLEMLRNKKWSHLFEDIDLNSSIQSSPEYYVDLMAAAGLDVIFCDQHKSEYIFEGEEQSKTFAESCCGVELVEDLSAEIKEELLKDTFSTFLRLYPRKKDGSYSFKYYYIEALAKKCEVKIGRND